MQHQTVSKRFAAAEVRLNFYGFFVQDFQSLESNDQAVTKKLFISNGSSLFGDLFSSLLGEQLLITIADFSYHLMTTRLSPRFSKQFVFDDRNVSSFYSTAQVW